MFSMKKIKRETVLELVFLFFLFCFYFMWARIQPLNAAPDENMRYKIAQYIYQYGKLPLGDDPAVRDSVWGISYAFNPILSYIFAAGLMKIMSLFTTNPFALVLAARMVSVICGVVTAYFVLKIGKKLFDQPLKAWMFTVLITMLPGMAFVCSYVNCDSMAIMSSAIIVHAWIMGLENNWQYKTCVELSVGIGFCALAYYNAYGFILCSILIFGSTLLISSKKSASYKGFVSKGAVVCILVLLFISWWFVRSYILYDGDILGRTASSKCAEKYAHPGYKPSDRETPQALGVSLWDMLAHGFIGNTVSWVELVSRSFVGRFGSLNICLPTWVENNYIDVIKFGVLLVFIHPVKTFVLRVKGAWKNQGIFNWTMLIAMIIPNVLNVYYSYASDYQPQGRYSLPMLIPLMYFVVMGWGNLFDGLIKDVKIRNKVYAVACILIFAGGVWAYFGTLWPEYMSVPFSIPAFLAGA